MVTLTFSGADTEFGSLADGRYTLTIFASQVSNANGNLDGNGDGTGGDNYVMAADPSPTIRKTEELVSKRSTHAYEEAATLLAELREALAGSERSGLAEEQARKLREKNPTYKMLISALRKKGFLGK